MKDKTEKIIDGAKSIFLHSEEKVLMRKNISDFAESHPINKIKSPYAAFLGYQRYAVFALLFVVIIGSGTASAANGSLPGDLLYPIKINVNEKVEKLLAVSPKAIAEVDVKQATRRLEEAETLNEKGALTPEINDQIKMDFGQKLDSLDSSLTKLDEKGDSKSADEVVDSLSADLENHALILSNVSEDSEKETVSPKAFSATAISSTTDTKGEDNNITKIVNRFKNRKSKKGDNNLATSTPKKEVQREKDQNEIE
jgi:hypothetical protein